MPKNYYRSSGVNHVLIFELDPRNHLSEQHLMELAAIFGVIWTISVLLFFYSGSLGIPVRIVFLNNHHIHSYLTVTVLIFISGILPSSGTCRVYGRFFVESNKNFQTRSTILDDPNFGKNRFCSVFLCWLCGFLGGGPGSFHNYSNHEVSYPDKTCC